MKYVAASFLLFTLPGCVTPMNQSDIEDVTTCKNTTLADIRRNLLLDGFKIDQESKNDLVTDFKQTDFWKNDRQFLRITAVEVGENTFKLKVRRKSIRIHESDSYGMGMAGSGRRNKASGSIFFDFSRPIEVEDEDDQTYYQEHLDRHMQLRKQICGT
jgi:hypothetical protein